MDVPLRRTARPMGVITPGLSLTQNVGNSFHAVRRGLILYVLSILLLFFSPVLYIRGRKKQPRANLKNGILNFWRGQISDSIYHFLLVGIKRGDGFYV